MTIPVSAADWIVINTELILVGTAMIVLLLDAFNRRISDRISPWITLVGVVGGLVSLGFLWGQEYTGFAGMLVIDSFSVLVKMAILFGTGLAVLLSVDYLRREELAQGEYYGLLLLSTVGMLLLTSSANLIMIFLSLEMLSIALYVLTGYARMRPRSQEAGMKYFLLGSFSAAILVYGVALIYGALGTVDLAGVAEALTAPGILSNPVLLAGAGLVLVGLGFKVAAVPFQMWTPDVYEGAPSPVTAFMSVSTKAAAFAALTRVLVFAFSDLSGVWMAVIWAIVALTMIFGNLVAIAQNNIKRMLAYSSIAHAGYILVAVASANQLGIQSIPFYLIAYTFMNIGAWAVVTVITRKGEEGVGLSDYTGLFWRNPLLAVSMGLFMFSLAGIPPTAGFTAKIYLFMAAVNANLIGLLIVAVVTTIISAYFYLRVTVIMFMHRPSEVSAVHVPIAAYVAIIIAVVATLWLFLFPNSTQAFTEAVWRMGL
ncbi:MAG TPA: NADH-quinone oxidoreductase subunit N [Armatimonadota bacterium]|nr:NADH-quinone oxidoreductase subunit N [Armatimonadota bacterium]